MCPVNSPPLSHLLAAPTPTPQSPSKCNSSAVIIITVAIMFVLEVKHQTSASCGKECILREIQSYWKAGQEDRAEVVWSEGLRIGQLHTHGTWDEHVTSAYCLIQWDVDWRSTLYPLPPPSLPAVLLKCPPSSFIRGSGHFCFDTLASKGAVHGSYTIAIVALTVDDAFI